LQLSGRAGRRRLVAKLYVPFLWDDENAFAHGSDWARFLGQRRLSSISHMIWSAH
jgi:hypothetical protein